MTTWLTVEGTRHQVAIAGHISDAETGRPIQRARIEVVAGPVVFMERLALHEQQHGPAWAALAERPDRTSSRADGHFHFLDLPDGDYTLAISLPGSASRYGQRQINATVTRSPAGDIAMALADATLPPTTLRGQVTDGAGGSPVALAQIRVNGSGETAFSSRDGRFTLAALEAGRRTVSASAEGYTTLTRQVILASAGDSATLDFALLPANATFAPTDLTGCRLWLRADFILGQAGGSPVSNWPDGSGQGNDATQAIVNRQPLWQSNRINLLPAVTFDGSGSYLRLGMTEAAVEHTFFFVYNLTALGGHANDLWDAESGRLALEAAEQNAPHRMRWRDAAWRPAGEAITGWQIVAWRFTGTNGEIFRNGALLGSNTYTPASLGGRIALGAHYLGNSNRFGGDIAEVICYNRALPDLDRQRVEQYLSTRYALPLA